jgi:CDP-diacylglycerol--glycerol-3-phosphate 3-phosphatidyltransferase
MPNFVQHLPNWITYCRLALVPVFVVLLRDPSQGMIYAAIIVFAVAALSDYVDGFLARRFNAITDIGKLLDPLVDKVLVMAALVMLVNLRSDGNNEPWVQPWLVILILARELWVTGLRGMAATRGIVMAAGPAAKWKTVFQMIAIVFLLLHEAYFSVLGFRILCQNIGNILLLLSIFFSIWSALNYTHAVLFEVKGQRK